MYYIFVLVLLCVRTDIFLCQEISSPTEAQYNSLNKESYDNEENLIPSYNPSYSSQQNITTMLKSEETPSDEEIQTEEVGDEYPTKIPGTACGSCMYREERKQLNLEIIKNDILTKLGITEAPNITGRVLPKLPPFHELQDRYGYGFQSDSPMGFQPGASFDDYDDESAKTEKAIAFAKPLASTTRYSDKLPEGIMFFNFSDRIYQNKILSAILWVYITPRSSLPLTSNVPEVKIYQVIKGDVKGDSTLLIENPSGYKHTSKETVGPWIKLNVSGLVKEWFKNPKNNMGIVIKASTGKGKNNLSVINVAEGDGQYIPFIEVTMQDGKKQRSKRNIGLNCNEKSREPRCCRYPLTVDFEEFGWDWIIAPKKYEANYCSGECPYVFLQKYPHTHIVQQANPSGTAGPCCSPRKMSPISMLYFDNDFNIILGLLPGMVVDRCGCS